MGLRGGAMHVVEYIQVSQLGKTLIIIYFNISSQLFFFINFFYFIILSAK